MNSVQLTAELDLADVKADIDRQMLDIMDQIVHRDIPAILRDEQNNGFPTNENDYDLILRNRGREAKRKLSTINARYLKVGSIRSPLEFKFISKGGGMQDAIAAAITAMEVARRRAPYDSGRYIESLGWFIYSGSAHIAVTSKTMQTFDYNDSDTIYITAPLPYSTTIERGFHSGYYADQTRKGGILIWVARKIRREYGSRVAIRFRYTKLLGDIVPAIEIGRLGQFPSNDYRVRTKKGRRRR